MVESQAKFQSKYQGFEDDYKAEILKQQLYLSRINFEQTRYKLAAYLKGTKSDFA